MEKFYRLALLSVLPWITASCVYDPGTAYYGPAPVYTRPSVVYTAPPPSPRYYHSYTSPRYVPPPPSYRWHAPNYPASSVQFYYSMPRGASYVRVGGNPCWFYNGHYYRRNPRGSGFVLFVP